MVTDEGKQYEQSCSLCASFTIYLDATPFAYFKNWIEERTAGASSVLFFGKTTDDRDYSLRLSPALEIGDEWKGRAERHIPVSPDLLAHLQQDRPIQQFYMDGWRSDILVPFRAIYIKVIRLKNGRLDVFIYSCDTAVESYANELAQNIKADWGPSQTDLTWEDALQKLGEEVKTRPGTATGWRSKFTKPERELLLSLWGRAHALGVSMAAFVQKVYECTDVEIFEHTIRNWRRPPRHEPE
jgi:hypothetical protein